MTDEKKKAESEIRKAVEEQKAKDDKHQKKENKEENKDAAQSKICELTDDIKRVQAEFENYKKRCDKESASFREYARADLIRKLLPVLDSFEMALANTKNHDDFVKGVELIFSQFMSILQDEGLMPIVSKGRKFDPYLDEVMLSEKSETAEDTVLEELQKGYKLKGCVIRHSKVKVAKK